MAGILELQANKQYTFGHNLGKLQGSELAEYIRMYVLWGIKELTEALDCVGWKTWTDDVPFDRKKYMEEIADTQLFLDNLKLAALLPHQTPEHLEMEYDDLVAKKIRQAMVRKSNGYTGIRCPDCSEDKSICRCGFDWEARERLGGL